MKQVEREWGGFGMGAPEVIELSLADQVAFAKGLLAPPSPTKALSRAISRRQELLVDAPEADSAKAR